MKAEDFNVCIGKTFNKDLYRDATPNGESFMKYYSMNDAEKEVFLGGTCNDSTWRDEIMPQLEKAKIAYFNPIVIDWSEEHIAVEELAKERCGIHLYVITPKMTGVYAIAEAVKSAVINPKGTFFVVISKDGDDEFSKGQIKSLNATCSLIVELGGTSITMSTTTGLHHVVTDISKVKRGFASTLITQIQSHPIKYGGVHGVQITYDFINLVRSIIQFFNDKFGSAYNATTIKYLKSARLQQEARTDERKHRKVEGYDKS